MGCCVTKKSEFGENAKKKLSISKQTFIKLKQGNVQDSYKIIKLIGEGTFGKVLKVIHKDTNMPRALKKISISQSLNIPQLLSEVNLLKKIDHPNIVRVFEVIQEPKSVNIIMELCTGGDLFTRIQSLERFSEENVRHYMLDIVLAIKYCHDHSIVHRDLKPENILFESVKDSARLKLIDFGTSKYFKPKEKLKGFAGSVYYVAPEVIQDNYDEKCDVWSLGVILYIMLSGKPPFKGLDDIQTLKAIQEKKIKFNETVWDNISASCKDLVEKMLVKNPESRIPITKVIEHEWFQPTHTFNNSLIIKQSLADLKIFSSDCCLKKATLHYITNQFISSDEIGNLRLIFEKLDGDNDGKLSKDELIKGYQEYSDDLPEDFDDIVEKCDIDGNGFIDYSEFLTAAMNRQKLLSGELLKAAFKVYDLDGNGKISTNEFVESLRGTGIDDNMIKEIVEIADKNQDGEIDYEEFEEYIRKPTNRC